MTETVHTWEAGLLACVTVFTNPSFVLFQELITAWILCPGRKTVTRMIRFLAEPPRRAHDAYHRFFRAGAWSLTALWKIRARRTVSRFVPAGPILIDLDDTLFHKSGRRVEGAGIFRDAVRSTAKHVVYALGLNLVVVTLRVVPAWGGEPLGLPIHVRLHRKGGPTLVDLAEDMIQDLASWFPGRTFLLCCDGAYAWLAGRSLPQTQITSRMRRDAALFEPPPPRKKGQRGRPRMKGRRLPTPKSIAARARNGWIRAEVCFRGRLETRLVLSRRVVWFRVQKKAPVLLVVVRDPARREPDDFFFTTDLTVEPDQIVDHYAGRWSIEDTFRNVKQFLGGQHPQSWKGPGPERAAAVSMWMYGEVWTWYIEVHGTKRTWPQLPWYRGKTRPSFADALAALRRALWRERISFISDLPPDLRKKTATLIEGLAHAA